MPIVLSHADIPKVGSVPNFHVLLTLSPLTFNAGDLVDVYLG
jgi:hypothetical protein